ncbi:hypothetical protein L3X38_041806 [Prunus dulcis]|uniref:Uncharacterized protein n=1 Tax=Prunus dulcis TaxID=3755 RepID=A0AAD4UTX7_PRUDU|nr:hypothetical protein L3X38_041806 [Prunus dulcis]
MSSGYSSKLNSTVHIHEATINSADLEAKPAAASAGRRHSLVHGGSQKLNRSGLPLPSFTCKRQATLIRYEVNINHSQGKVLPSVRVSDPDYNGKTSRWP